MSKKAICPGSFDPVTVGHLDIVSRAAQLFDEVVVVVMNNSAKTPLFSADERVDMLKKVTADMPNVSVDRYDGLLADYAKEKDANVVVKGLRAVSDFEYEFQMALTNKKLNHELDTVFLTTKAENMYLSSSLVRQVGAMGGDISEFVPAEIKEQVLAKLRK